MEHLTFPLPSSFPCPLRKDRRKGRKELWAWVGGLQQWGGTPPPAHLQLLLWASGLTSPSFSSSWELLCWTQCHAWVPLVGSPSDWAGDFGPSCTHTVCNMPFLPPKDRHRLHAPASYLSFVAWLTIMHAQGERHATLPTCGKWEALTGISLSLPSSPLRKGTAGTFSAWMN